MANYTKWLGYILFATILSGVFLYFCFPSDVICRYLEGSAARLAPALALKVQRIRPVFPLGLRLEKTNLDLKERPEFPLFKADSFVVMPSIQVLALRRPAFRFDCAAYGGKIQGVIAFKTFSLGGPLESDIEISSVRLDRYPYLRQWLNGELTGVVSGTVVYACSQGDFLQGSGEGDLSISDSSLRLAQPFLGMESLHFRRIDAQIALDKQMLYLDRFDFSGEQMEGEVSGTIYLENSIAQSSLDLTVTLREFSALRDNPGLVDMVSFLGQGLKEGNLTISIHGTVAEPMISFI